MTLLPRPADEFVYKYLEGPVGTVEELKEGRAEGNCRYALQVYFYRMHDLYLERDQIYLPGGYKSLGRFVYKEEPIDFETLQPGDVIYAENLRNKKGERINKSLEQYETKDKWLYDLHSAIYLGKDGDTHYVWHATSIEGRVVVWPLTTFLYNYRPVSIKRVL